MIKKPEDSPEETVEEYNRLAMSQLTSEKYSHAIAYLNQALFKVRLMPDSLKKNSLTALTYNNLGCFYKRLGQVDQALEYFYKSLELENNGINSIESVANTHLNISCLLSIKGSHEKALRYGIKALVILKKSYKDNPGLIVSILNSYQRIGDEYRSLAQYTQALQCFKKGYEISSRLKNSKNQQKNFKRMYIDCVAEMGSDKAANKADKSKYKLKNKSLSPSLDSHTTVWSQNTSYVPITPKKNDQYIHQKRGSLVLPPMEDFNIGKKPYLGSIYEVEQMKKKKLNSNKHKAHEKLAATVIQSFWRGYQQRKMYYKLLITKKIKEAEIKAKKAIDEIKILKNLAQNPKQVLKINRKN
jgi:tetratricopeptide (TPR) repeat protein